MFYSVAVVGRNVNQQHIEEGHITSVFLVCIHYYYTKGTKIQYRNINCSVPVSNESFNRETVHKLKLKENLFVKLSSRNSLLVSLQ